MFRVPSSMLKASVLLSNDFIRRLDALALLVRKAMCASVAGFPRSHLKGGSVEFAEHREYTPGDEWRYIDWNVYGRTERLFVREFSKEESLDTRILLDVSGSMAFGVPGKFDLACRVAAAIAYVSMNEDAQVHIMPRSGTVSRELSGLRGKGGIAALLQFLTGIEPDGRTTLSRALNELAAHGARRSSVVVVSDLLDDGPVREGLSLLAEQGHEVTVLHVLGEEVRASGAEQVARLVDTESGEAFEVLLDERTAGSYYSELDRFCARWREFTRARNIGYLSFPSHACCEEIVLDCLRNGLVFRLARRG